MGFTFVAADRFGHTVVLSGEDSRQSSVTVHFDCDSFNSVEQTLTVVVVSFMVAPSLFPVGRRAGLVLSA